MSDHTGMQKCADCGQWHPLELLEPIFRWPDDVARVPKTAWSYRVKANEDLCVLDARRHFVRCVLPFVVHDRDQNFAIGCWAEVSKADFASIVKLWRDEDQGSASPFDAVISNALPNMPDMRGLPALLQLRSLSLRPALTLTDTQHPLFADQRDGIKGHRVFVLQGQATPL